MASPCVLHPAIPAYCCPVVHCVAPDNHRPALEVFPSIPGVRRHCRAYFRSDQTGGVQTRMTRGTAASRKHRILIVDDDDCLRRWLRAQLEARGFWVHEESQGDEALETYRQKGPWDFVLSDLYFFRGKKIRNGLDLVKAIATVCQEQPMAIHTSEHRFEAPCPVLHKPYTVGALLRLLRNPVMPIKSIGDRR